MVKNPKAKESPPIGGAFFSDSDFERNSRKVNNHKSRITNHIPQGVLSQSRQGRKGFPGDDLKNPGAKENERLTKKFSNVSEDFLKGKLS